MTTSSSTEPSDYMREALHQDRLLDEKLARIRAAEANGHITVREAADERVSALEHHIEAVRYLRAEHFGEEGTNT